MEDIVISIKRVTDSMAGITAATQQQSAGIKQVNQAIGQMDQVTQQNAALVEQAAAASALMQDQASNLSRAVSVCKLDDSRAVASTTVRRPIKDVTPAPDRLAPKSAGSGHVLATAKTKRVEPQTMTKTEEWEQF